MAVLSRLLLLVAVLLITANCGRQSDTIVAIAPHPRNPDIAYVATNESLYKTRNGGTTWNSVQVANSVDTIQAVSATSDATVWVGTAAGTIYATQDGGTNWTRQYTDPSYRP